MKLSKITPVLYTNDLIQTFDFYTQLLGFQSVNLTSEWASVVLGECSLMFSIPNAHIPFGKASFTGSFYFEVENINQVWEHLHDKVDVCYPIEDFEYGMQEFAIYDNNGYLLQFGEELAIPPQEQ